MELYGHNRAQYKYPSSQNSAASDLRFVALESSFICVLALILLSDYPPSFLYTLSDSDVASWFATSAVQRSISVVSVLYSKHVVIIYCPRGAAPVVRYGTIARALR